jgi:DNA-binding beta-propeller fold protein YncE
VRNASDSGAIIVTMRLFVALLLVVASAPGFASEPCGSGTYPFPYTDVAGVGDAFCPGIMEAYVTGVSKGTTPTTFSPNDTVTRVQMTTFLQRSLDQELTRTSRRAALNQWWTPQVATAMQTVVVGGTPQLCAADGDAVWTTTLGSVVQVQAASGNAVNLWTGATSSQGVLVAAGKVFVTGVTAPGTLYVIDPTQGSGAVTVAAGNLGNNAVGIAFDGTHIWTANNGGSVSIVTPQAATPYPVTTVTTGFVAPNGVLYDGTNIWVTDNAAGTLLKLDSAGGILQTVAVGAAPQIPVFDGANIWVPSSGDNSVTVVQASSGNVVATLTADASNQLNGPRAASFDGERVLVTNTLGSTVTVFKAADLSVIANVTTGASSFPYGVCSDGINFWVPLAGATKLLRF